MHILKSQVFSDQELIEYAANLSQQKGELKDKLLHWDFGPLMTMSYEESASNYLFSSEKVPFHWDGAFYKEPKFLLFYCTQTQGVGGETLFVDTEKIWAGLTEEERRICAGITLTYKTQKLAHYGGEIHIPLVQKHPVSGNTILRFAEKVETNLNPVEMIITGIDRTEEFYAYMQKKLYSPEYLYEHSWEKGDLLIVDNFTYLHGRRELRENRGRTFKRIQIL